jgi:molybdate transport repressor ModE-like protein
MKLQDIQALLWIVQHGSIQGASRAVGVPRTTLRRRLENLEDVLGTAVLHSRAGHLRLTPTGELIAEQGQRLLSQRDALLQRARSALEAPSGKARVLLSSGFPTPLVAHLMARAAEGNPDIKMDLCFSDDPLRSLSEDIDLVVYWGSEMPTRDGYSRTIIRIPMGIMASPDYIRQHGAPQSIADLQHHSILQHTSEPPSWPLLGGGHVPVQPTHRIGDLYVLGGMVSAGMGLALLPAPNISLDPLLDPLVRVLLADIGQEQVVRFFVPIHTSHGGPAAALVKLLNQFADQVNPQ